MSNHPRELICIQCKKGVMRPAVSEGEPDFTDHYICETCQFEDYIPTPGIIVGQLITCLLGGAICLYLLADRFDRLMVGIYNNDLQHAINDILLLLIATTFLAGFIFLLSKCYKGLHHRRTYLASNRMDAPPTQSHRQH